MKNGSTKSPAIDQIFLYYQVCVSSDAGTKNGKDNDRQYYLIAYGKSGQTLHKWIMSVKTFGQLLKTQVIQVKMETKIEIWRVSKMKFEEKKAKILDALIDHSGIQHIINVASEVLNNPVFVCDMSCKLLAHSNLGHEDDTMWQELFPNEQMEYQRLIEVEKAGVYKKMLTDDKPVYGQFGFYPCRFLGARIREKQKVVGLVTIIERNHISQEDEELLIVVCKIMLFEMLYRGRIAMQAVPYFGLFLDLLEHSITKVEMNERIKDLRLSLPAFQKLLYISYESQEPMMSHYYIRECLEMLHCVGYSIIYKNHIIILINSAECNDSNLAAIRTCFADVPIKIGISRQFNDLWYFAQAYNQASEAIKLNSKLGIDTTTCYYDTIYLYHFLKTASKECDLRMFCNPHIEQLAQYDAENNTDFNKTVETFLDCGRNIQRAAKKLFLHKNTLYYRIRKIEEVFGINLEDENVCFALQFSYRLQQMSE